MTFFKFFRFLCAASVLVVLAGNPARAADDLPAPAEGALDELPSAPESKPQPPPIADDLMDSPAPSLGGEDSLPSPSADTASESSKNVVNQSGTTDDIFLPSASSDINLAPVSSSYSSDTSVVSANEANWQSGMGKRPIFSLAAGAAVRNYPTVLVEGLTTGYAVQASVRLASLGQTVFAHVFGGASFFKVGDVGKGTYGPSYGGVEDKTYHVGGIVEVGMGRRLSLFGSLARRWNNLTYEPAVGPNAEGIKAQRNPAQLQYIGESPGIRLGVGGQYDFYVIPHGSVGLQARIEKDYYYVGLTMSMEPAPQKKMNLNFDSIDN